MALLFFIATFTAAMITACKPVETKYRVTFIANDVIVSTMQSAGNEEISLPTAPTVDGFEFEGWFLDPDTWEQPFDGKNFADKPITADVNVYAKYEKTQTPEPQKYAVNFYANGQLVSSTQSAGNEEIQLPTAPTVDGFTFKGWFLDLDTWQQPFDGKNFADNPITAEVNVYAKYEKTQPTAYLVEFDTDGGSAVSSMTVSVIETSPYTEKSGYQFVGWYKDADRT